LEKKKKVNRDDSLKLRNVNIGSTANDNSSRFFIILSYIVLLLTALIIVGALATMGFYFVKLALRSRESYF